MRNEHGEEEIAKIYGRKVTVGLAIRPDSAVYSSTRFILYNSRPTLICDTLCLLTPQSLYFMPHCYAYSTHQMRTIYFIYIFYLNINGKGHKPLTCR